MDEDVTMKLKLEDILFLNLTGTTKDNASRLSKLSNAYVNKASYENYTKLKIALQASYESKTDEAIEQLVIEELKGKFYPKYLKFFKSNYKDSLDKSMKNSEKSAKVRIRGNELFAKESHDIQAHEDIWRLYSKSIAFAPAGSKELVLAYECRSSLLLHFKKYTDCVKDIDKALAITDFHLLKVKLLCRKMTCFAAMDKNIDEKKELWVSIEEEFEKVVGPLKDDKFLKIVKQAENDSSSQPIKKSKNASSSVPLVSFPNIALVCNKEKLIAANRDFVPGEEVIVTKPTVTAANPDMFYAYCSHCLSFMWAGIPCDECSLCMYCSEECKTEAWEKYHILECKILPHLNFDDVIYFDLQMSIRFFFLGLREFGSLSELKKEIDKLKDNPKLVKKNELFDSDFLNFYICTVDQNSNVSVLAKNACFLVAYMIETCNIFEKDLKLLKGKDLSKNEDVVFCGLVMTKLLLLTKLSWNSPHQTYTKISKINCQNIGKFKRSPYKGRVFHPFQRMFEKSCNPNVAKFWTDDGKIIYLCVKPIKKCEKISSTSSIEFFYCNRLVRDKLFSLYFGVCKCDPCMKNWPPITKLHEKFMQRQSKSNKKETNIVQKYLEKNKHIIDFAVEKNWILNATEFQELAKDVNDVVNAYGQPSFASSFLISILNSSYEKLYGTVSLQSHIPTD